MSKVLSMKSYVLFLLLGLSFFSCEQLIEIIKPTHPKPTTDTCRIKSENGKEFVYDQEGKLVRIKDYGISYEGPAPLIFVYNEKDQIIQYYVDNGGEGPSRVFDYDSQGRLTEILHYFEFGMYARNTISYKTDTIVIDYKMGHEVEDDGPLVLTHHLTTLCFKNEDLVRAYRPANETYQQSFDHTYTYTNTLNKVRDQKKKLVLLLEDFANPLMSKHLPASRRNTQGQNQGTITYTWLFNEQGYPVNNGLTNQIVYTYECEE
jgi:hypothetical protein